MRLTRRPAAWKVFLALGIAGCAAYLIGPLRGSDIILALLGFSPLFAIVAGVIRHRPAAKGAWLLLASGSALFSLGGLYAVGYEVLTGKPVPFPSPADAGYLGMYPVLLVGLLLLVRHRSRGSDRGALLDGLILTVGLALPAWVALIAPQLQQGDVGLWAKLMSVAYPLGDIILLGAAIRLALAQGRREPAFRALIASIVLLTTTDFAYGITTLHGVDALLWLNLGWLGSAVLWGVAGLHPSMARLAEPAPRDDGALTRFRLTLLTCASLVAPALAMANDIRKGDFDFVVIQACSIALFAVVVARMTTLMRRQRVLSSELERRRGEARRPRQSPDVHRAHAPGARALPARPELARGPVPRSRRLQGDQRFARPRGR